MENFGIEYILNGSDATSEVCVRMLGGYSWEILDGNGASVAIDLVNCGARHCYSKIST